METKKEILANDNLIASLVIPEYHVEFYITYLGGMTVKYDMFYKGELLFSGNDFKPSPLRDQDHIENVLAGLSFLCLRDGDTDKEYFKNYSQAQLDWTQTSDCETLSYLISDTDSSEDEYKEFALAFFSDRFTNTVSK